MKARRQYRKIKAESAVFERVLLKTVFFNSERTMMPEYGMKMLFKNCHPRYGQRGYVYVLNKEKFVHAMGRQWVAYNEQIPIDVIEINVDEYVEDYCILVE